MMNIGIIGLGGGASQMIPAFVRHPHIRITAAAVGLVAQAAVRLGLTDEATELAEGAGAAMSELEGALRWSLAASLSDVWIDLGMRDRAVAAVDGSVDEARAAGASLHEAELLATAGRAGSDVRDRLDELTQVIDGPLWALQARHLHSILDRDGGEDAHALASAYRALGQRRLADLVGVGA
jgi:hypothetical protein